ncbi:MAG: hypothetical protein U0930_10575 [Pirellulales bacterium]
MTSIAKPWLVDKVNWDERMIKCAVLWLCECTGKALLKLDDEIFVDTIYINYCDIIAGPAQKRSSSLPLDARYD